MFRRRFRRSLFTSGGARSRHRLPKAVIIISIIMLAVILLLMFSDSRMRPVISQYGVARANAIATKAINDAVTERLAKSNINYDDIVYFEKDESGNIAALRTNISKVNQFKAMVTDDILSSVTLEQTKINIPIGNFIGGDFFSGRGFKIPFKLVPLGSVKTDIKNVFVAAGINQTRHQIMIDITAHVSILMPFSTAIGSDVTTSICVAETVIVGKVPNVYGDTADMNITE